MSRFRIWHLMVAVAAAGLIVGTDGDPVHAVIHLLVVALCVGFGVAGARYSYRSVWSGFWPIFLFGPFGLLITWSYPRRRASRGRDLRMAGGTDRPSNEALRSDGPHG